MTEVSEAFTTNLAQKKVWLYLTGYSPVGDDHGFWRDRKTSYKNKIKQ